MDNTLKEKFTIQVTETGLLVQSDEGVRLEFTAGEALMLLDILRNEEGHLKKAADKASPMPMRLHFE